jgi:hypothetical protein
MSTTKARSNDGRGPAGVDMRLEVVAIPSTNWPGWYARYMVDERVGRDGQRTGGWAHERL